MKWVIVVVVVVVSC